MIKIRIQSVRLGKYTSKELLSVINKYYIDILYNKSYLGNKSDLVTCNEKFLYYFAHYLFGLLVGGGLLFITKYYKNNAYNPRITNTVIYMAVVLTLLSNDWSTTWNAIIDGQIWKILLLQTIHWAVFVLFFVGFNFVTSFNWYKNKESTTILKFSAAMVVVLAVFSPYYT